MAVPLSATENIHKTSAVINLAVPVVDSVTALQLALEPTIAVIHGPWPYGPALNRLLAYARQHPHMALNPVTNSLRTRCDLVHHSTTLSK